MLFDRKYSLGIGLVILVALVGAGVAIRAACGSPNQPAHHRALLAALPPKGAAEVKVLRRGPAKLPASVRSGALAGWGSIRQNTYAKCYRNASRTEWVCTMQIRRGAEPRMHARYNVVMATGAVVLHGYSR